MARRLLFLTATVFMAMAATAGSAQTLRIGYKAAVEGADPHIAYTPNRNLQLHVWDTLLAQDDTLRPIPSLATSWRAVDDLTWEFKLRPGVTFSDGTPLTAEDAIFSIRRAQGVTNPRNWTSQIRNIAAMEAPDPQTLILRMRAPTPLQPDFLPVVPIISAKHAVDATDADFNGGRAAMGSGPYRWIQWTPGDRVVLERNPSYWGAAEPWQRVEFRFIANDSARVSALLAGDVDVIDAVPAGLYQRVRSHPDTTLVAGDSIFTHYLYLDSVSPRIANATAKDGSPLPGNPLADLKVRQALSHALNRRALAERIMEGGATATGQMAPEGFIGHDPGIEVPKYDPALARRLLAEAGYPNGFTLNLQCTAERFAGDVKTCQAVGQMLTAIGIEAKVETLPISIYFRRSAALVDGVPELSAHMAMFGSSTGIASEGMNAILRTPNAQLGHGTWNRTRYANAELDAAIAKAASQFDPAQREADSRAAMRLAMQQIGVMPIFHVKASWGLRKPLTMPVRGDTYTMATEIRRAP
jgi:peptide/nickel transport system substrate-binding protein